MARFDRLAVDGLWLDTRGCGKQGRARGLKLAGVGKAGKLNLANRIAACAHRTILRDPDVVDVDVGGNVHRAGIPENGQPGLTDQLTVLTARENAVAGIEGTIGPLHHEEGISGRGQIERITRVLERA